MADNKCSECGSSILPGATRCAVCGAPVGGNVRRCPECDKMIPAKSVFCPCCGKMVWNDMEEGKTPAQHVPMKTDVKTEKHEDITEDLNESTDKKPANRNRTKANRIITFTLVIVVICLAIYSIYDWGGGGDKTTNPYLALTGNDTIKRPEPERMNIVEASGIYGDAMVHDNRIGDLSTFGPAAYTLHGEKPLIVGINYFSGDKQRSFLKLTQIHKIDDAWRCGDETLRHEDDGIIVMDRDRLRLSGENIPRFVDIDGKHYFYFIYLVNPSEKLFGTSARNHLKLSLFNIESTDIVQLDYECEPVIVRGETLYYGSVENRRETPEFEFLASELDKLPIVYHPTPEEQEMAMPANASRKWLADNSELLGELKKGKRKVTFVLTYYDSPLFSRGDVAMDSRVSTEVYVYYATHTGTVFGYNRNSKKFFIVYVDSRGSVPQIEINSDGTLHVAAIEVDFDFDPATTHATLN